MANLLSTTVNGSLLALNNGVTNAYTTASNGRLYLGSSAQNDYSIYTHMENFGGNYTKLTLDWHTGIKIGASQGYGGIRFYNDAINNGGVKLFSVGEGDAHVRVENNLYVGNTIYNNGNAVIHAGNIGSQSVSYAGSAGNSNTTSQITFTDFKANFPSGGGGGHSFGPNHYSMGLDSGNGGWNHPHYRDLIIGYHTGVRIGAHYSGIRFYNDSPTTDANNDGNGDRGEALLMTIGGYVGTENHTDVVVNNNLFANVSMRAPIFYDSQNTGYYGDFASTSRMNAIVYDNLYFSGDQTYGFIGRNVYADTINGRGSDPLELNYYDGGGVIIGPGATGSKALYAGSLFSGGSAVITAANIGSQSVSYATTAGSAPANGGTSTHTYRGIIEDTRAGQRTPNAYDDYRVSWEFTNQMPHDSDWLSVMTMQGWSNGYAAWQIMGIATTSAYENWYLRSGVNGTWNAARTIIHSGNIGAQSVSYAASAGVVGNADTVSSITGNTGLMINRLTPTSFIDGLTTSTFRSSLFNTTSNGAAISAARWNSVPAPLSGMGMYGTMIAWSGDSDTHGFVATDYAAPIVKVGGGYGNIIAWTATLVHSGNIGSQTVGQVNQTEHNRPAILLNSSGSTDAGGSLGMQQVTAEGWTGIFVDYEPYTGWGLWHDNPNNYFSFTAEASTGSIRSFTVPSRESGNRTAYEKFRIDQAGGDIIVGRDGYAQSSFRAPIFYDSNDTVYYGDFNSRSVLNSLQLGSAPSDTSNLKLDVQGNMAIRGSNGLYFGVSTNNYNSWSTRIYASGSTQYFNAQQFVFDNQGYGGTTFASINSSGLFVANNYVSNYFSLESSRAVGEFGNVGMFRARRSATADYPSFSFQHQYGNHSWGQIARFHIEATEGSDRPSIQFSSGHSNTRWNVGYCYNDDNFRISQNMGYRPDMSGNYDSWGTERFRINTDGSMYCFSSFTASGDVTAYSDIRVKDNIETIPNAIDKVKSIRGVTFTRTDNDDNKKYMGVIAQELLNVIPEVVSETDSGMYTVAYGNITAVLIEAIKEQQKQIDELKAKLDGLTK